MEWNDTVYKEQKIKVKGLVKEAKREAWNWNGRKQQRKLKVIL